MGRGFFVAFEGGEGTGKSTQIRRLEARLKNSGIHCVVTWEPGGTELGLKIRDILLNPATKSMSARCEALLYAAVRAEHVDALIEPALQNGSVVLCDRYWDASIAYQGVARKLGIRWIDEINGWATGNLRPHHTFVFDLPATKGLERAKSRGEVLDRIESEGVTFHDTVHRAYLDLCRNDPTGHTRVDASLGLDEIEELIWKKVSPMLSS